MLPVYVALQPNDPTALASYAQAVSTPGSALYRHYLDVHQFAQRFGPSRHAVQAVRHALVAAGLRPGTVSANHLSISVRASAGSSGQRLCHELQEVRVGRGPRRLRQHRVAPDRSQRQPLHPSGGGTGRPLQRDRLQRSPHRRAPLGLRSRAPRRPNRTWRRAVPNLVRRAQDDAGGSYTADQYASAYGFSSLYQRGDFGAGQTVALVEFESNLSSDIASYQSCYGVSPPVTYVPVDGGAGGGSGSG